MHACRVSTYLKSCHFPSQCKTLHLNILLRSAPRKLDETLDYTWNGGCLLSVWDSDLAEAWVDENYDQPLLVRIRKRHIGGPIPSMLSADSPALTIFGKMSVSLIRVAEKLANFSGFPVIVKSPEEHPSQFRWEVNINYFSASLTIVVGVALRTSGPANPLTDRRVRESNRKMTEPPMAMKESQGFRLGNHPSRIKKLLQRRSSTKQMWN